LTEWRQLVRFEPSHASCESIVQLFSTNSEAKDGEKIEKLDMALKKFEIEKQARTAVPRPFGSPLVLPVVLIR